MPRRWRVRPQWDGDDGRRAAVYYSVCESYRDQAGVPRHRTIENLGAASSPGELAQALLARASQANLMLERSVEMVGLLEASLGRRNGHPDPELDAEFGGWDEQNLRNWQLAVAAWKEEVAKHAERALLLEALHQRTVDPSWVLMATLPADDERPEPSLGARSDDPRRSRDRGAPRIRPSCTPRDLGD